MSDDANLLMIKTEGRWFSLFRWIGGAELMNSHLEDSECEKY